MEAGGGENETDRDVAIDDIQVRLVSAPAFDFALAVFLAAPVACGWQIGEIGRPIARDLLL
jgi:hypothetical protein